jgi:hypothetical protein
MKYLVQISHGEYSYYSLDNILIGDVPPEPLIDAHIKQVSNGEWESYDACWKDMCLVNANGRYDPKLTSDKRDRQTAVVKSCVDMLKANGFVEHEHFELWCGLR